MEEKIVKFQRYAQRRRGHATARRNGPEQPHLFAEGRRGRRTRSTHARTAARRLKSINCQFEIPIWPATLATCGPSTRPPRPAPRHSLPVVTRGPVTASRAQCTAVHCATVRRHEARCHAHVIAGGAGRGGGLSIREAMRADLHYVLRWPGFPVMGCEWTATCRRPRRTAPRHRTPPGAEPRRPRTATDTLHAYADTVHGTPRTTARAGRGEVESGE